MCSLQPRLFGSGFWNEPRTCRSGPRYLAVASIIQLRGSIMKYKVALHRSEEGYSVSCPGLPGCWSQGQTEEEALENIRDAIREYLEAVNETIREAEVREIEVSV